MLSLESRSRELTRDLLSIMSAVDSGIITLTPSGRVRSMNAAAVRILDGAIDELGALLGPLSGDLTPGSPQTVELQSVRRPDRWFELTRYVAKSDGAGVVIIRDVTDARRSRGLREAFLGMLSHELRTPVTSIYAATSLLRARRESLGREDQEGLIEDISEEADRLLRLVEDLLVLAHFDGGLSLVREPSLLQRVIPPVVERERRHWPGLTIELRAEPGVPVVTGDETSVQQVVRNLISNAGKYGKGAPIGIEITAAEEPEGGATVRVLDRGPGISPQEAEALFRPFFRSTHGARTSSGAGIGLYVCRQLVEAMGGRIWARRRDGSGSEFGFWLPGYQVDPDDDHMEVMPPPGPRADRSASQPRFRLTRSLSRSVPDSKDAPGGRRVN